MNSNQPDTDDTERLLLKRLEENKADPDEAMWELARFYSYGKRHEEALSYLRRVMDSQKDPEGKAECVLAMGQTMEQVADYEAAIRYYHEALRLEPTDTRSWYFINNNLGFSLNTLGRFEEGEAFCARAVKIDPDRPNGHKNLGLALQGQGRLREAARSFIAATQANAADARSCQLLARLLAGHPELAPEFAADLEPCRNAVGADDEFAQRLGPAMNVVTVKGPPPAPKPPAENPRLAPESWLQRALARLQAVLVTWLWVLLVLAVIRVIKNFLR